MPTEKQLDITLESELEFNSPSTYLPMSQSNEPTIEQMNEAIALFDGYKVMDRWQEPPNKFLIKDGAKQGVRYNSFKYHTSWDWLKPVIDEIINYILVYPEQVRSVREMSIMVNIRAAHERVYKFCKWLNQQKQP